MNANRPGHGGQPGQYRLHLLAGGGHKIGELVDQNHPVGDLLDGQLVLGRLLVVGANIPGSDVVQHGVAPLHLVDAVLQRLKGPFWFGNHRGQQMRNAVIGFQLYDLRIDEQDANIFRCLPEQDRTDDGVDADGLSAARCPGNEEMRGLGQIDQLSLSGDVFTQRDGNLHPGILKILQADNLFERDNGSSLVGHFNPHGVFPRYGRHDSDPGGGQTQGDIVGQIDDLGDLHSGRGKDLEHCDHRALADSRDLGTDLELLQSLHQHLGGAAGIGVDLPVLPVRIVLEQSFDGKGVNSPRESCLPSGIAATARAHLLSREDLLPGFSLRGGSRLHHRGAFLHHYLQLRHLGGSARRCRGAFPFWFTGPSSSGRCFCPRLA